MLQKITIAAFFDLGGPASRANSFSDISILIFKWTN